MSDEHHEEKKGPTPIWRKPWFWLGYAVSCYLIYKYVGEPPISPY